MTTRTSLLESSVIALKRTAVNRVQPMKKPADDSSGVSMGYRGKPMTMKTVRRDAYTGYTENTPYLSEVLLNMRMNGREFALMCERYQDEGKDVKDVFEGGTHHVEVHDNGSFVEEWSHSFDTMRPSVWTKVM